MSQKKKAFITGVTGQDGALLARFLRGKNYDVHGLVRYDAQYDVSHLEDITIHYGDLTDAANITRLIKEIRPDEIYNLAALSHVRVSFDTPSSALDINAKGALYIFEAVRLLGLEDSVRIYQASSSEMFGFAPAPQHEETPFAPCSPYGVAKLAAYWLARTYRDGYGLHASNGILFNHESPLRGEGFVTRKITKAVAAIEAGLQEKITLGNLDAMRDWGHAADYVEGMWMMLQKPIADDYVLASGQAHSVREFVMRAFAQIGVVIEWEGGEAQEVGRDASTGRVLIDIDQALYRPNEVSYLLGDATKANQKLGWVPKIGFDALVSEMVNEDRALLRDQGGRKWARRAG